MEISKLAVAIVVAMCVGAGAGGAYLATRATQDPVPAADVAGSARGAAAVEQSEALVEDVPPASAAPDLPVAPPRPEPVTARRADATAGRAARSVAPRREPRAEAAPQSVPAPIRERIAPTPERPVPAPVAPRAADVDMPRPVTPAPTAYELVIPSDAVVGLQVDTAVSSETAQVEDPIVAHVTRDVRVGERVAIPAGSKVQGEVTLVERGGKVRERARLGVRFTSVVLADGTRVPIETDTIYREGDAPTGRSAAKIGGGAIGGAILGGILGGAKGAVIGGSAGAGAGTAAVLAGGRSTATLSQGSPVTVRVQQPVTVVVDQ